MLKMRLLGRDALELQTRVEIDAGAPDLGDVKPSGRRRQGGAVGERR